MDNRISQLLTDFPVIFEKVKKNLEDLEKDWVIIEVSVNEKNSNDVIEEDHGILNDLDRFDNEPGSLVTDTSGGYDRSTPPFDVPLPADIDLDKGGLVDIIWRPRPKSIDDLRRKILGDFPGGPGGKVIKGSLVPPPDALAVYLPFHRYPTMWGIYLLDAGVASLAKDLQTIVMLLGRSITTHDARKAALTYLFHHEAYHSAVEAFGFRCELPLRKPVYRTCLRRLYTRIWILGDPHEETLATAYGIRKVRDNLRLPKKDVTAVVNALRVYMCLCPPPYKAGADYTDDEKFNELERKFMEEALRLSSSKALPPAAWTMGTYLMAPLIQRNRKYSWICSRADFRKKSKLAVHYFRQRDVLSCLQRLAGAVVEPGGRHQHVVREVEENGSKRRLMSPIPSGEIHRGTLGSMLKQLKLSLNVETFRDECRKVGKTLS
jgi:hypothetical protein